MELKNEVKRYLLKLEDKKYLEFSKDLNAKVENFKQIGVRIPMIRSYAKELSKSYDLAFLMNNIDEEYYEAKMEQFKDILSQFRNATANEDREEIW